MKYYFLQNSIHKLTNIRLQEIKINIQLLQSMRYQDSKFYINIRRLLRHYQIND